MLGIGSVLTTASGAASGANSREWFASYDRDSSSWRTSQACLFAGWDAFSETWPRSGMTLSGFAYERPTSGPRIDDSESLSWPTPDASVSNEEDLATWDARRQAMKAKGYNGNGCGTPLAQAVQMWPTPQAYQAPDGMGKPTSGPLDRAMRSSVGLVAPEKRSKGGNLPASSVVLNPAWVSCLMGFPPDWCDIGDAPLKR